MMNQPPFGAALIVMASNLPTNLMLGFASRVLALNPGQRAS
jgi:hypothetical protein